MSCKKKVCVFLLIFAMASMANAAAVWNPAANPVQTPPFTWSDPCNWHLGIYPDAVNKAVFNVPGAAECLLNTAESTRYWAQGDGGPGGVVRVVSGGTLSQTEVHWAGVGWDNTAQMIVETGGVVNHSEHMWVGFHPGGVGTFDINGGTVNVAQMIGLGWGGGTGYVNVNDGGVLNLSNIHGDGTTSIQGVSRMVVTGTGLITIPGDFVAVMQAYIDIDRLIGVVVPVYDDFGVIIQTNVVSPEPATMILLGLGGLLIRRRRA